MYAYGYIHYFNSYVASNLIIYYISLFDGPLYHATSSVMVLSSTEPSFTKLNRHITFGFLQGRRVFKGTPFHCLHRSSRTILFAISPPLLPHQVLRCEEIRPDSPFRLRSPVFQKEPISSTTVIKSLPQSYGFLPSSHNSFTV